MASALGDQLAALSRADPARAGVVPAAGIAGRGARTEDATRRPSLLYDNAAEAAGVTADALREEAVRALRRLGDEAAATVGAAAGDDGAAARALWRAPRFLEILSAHHMAHCERGTATPAENRKVDATINELLGLLMTMVMEHPPLSARIDAAITSTLQVLEYLVRHHRIHARPATASALLVCLLPLQASFPAAYPALFPRVLALVDLGSMPEWTWLRPYAARGGPPLTRGAVAKFAGKDAALTKIVALIGSKGREVCLREHGEHDSKHGGSIGGGRALSSRRGVGALLSFSASVLVEALHIKSVAPGGVPEGLVRVLFPFVLAACADGAESGSCCCPEWKEWGRLLAATVSARCPLGVEGSTALCDAVAKGLPAASGSGVAATFDAAVEAVENNKIAATERLSREEADDASSAVMTLLSVLGSVDAVANDKGTRDDDGGWELYLPMLPPKQSRGEKQPVIDYMGCDLTSSTYKRLLRKEEATSRALGVLCGRLIEGESGGEVRRGIQIAEGQLAPLVAAAAIRALSRLERVATGMLQSSHDSTLGSAKKKRRKSAQNEIADTGSVGDGTRVVATCRADGDVLLLLRLINEPSLSPLWSSRCSALVAAVTVHTIAGYQKLQRSLPSNNSAVESAQESAVRKRYTSILKALSNTDSRVYEQGVAYAINTTIAEANDAKNLPEKRETVQKASLTRLARLLGRDSASLVLPGVATTKKGNEETQREVINMDAAPADLDEAIARLLPPRVSLEHAIASVRLDAIARLKASFEDGSAKEDKEIGAEDSVGRALLRRLETDDDPQVAAAAGEMVAGALRKLAHIGNGEGEDMEVDRDENKHNIFIVLVENELDTLAREALACLFRWTSLGTEGGEATAPLLCCISICGLVAQLILQDGWDTEHGSDSQDLPVMTQLFYALFLSVGAHVVHNGEGSTHSTKLLSNAASTALLRITCHDKGDIRAASYADVTSLMTANSLSQGVVVHFCSAHHKENVTEAAMGVVVPKALQMQFVRMASHCYYVTIASMPLADESRDEVTEMHCTQHKKKMVSPVVRKFLCTMLDLIIYQMQAYAKTAKKNISCAAKVQSQVLSETCRRYLTSPVVIQHQDTLEEAILKLASTSKKSFLDISKSVIANLLVPDVEKKYNFAPGGLITVLVHACLRPDARKEGISRILDIIVLSPVPPSAKSSEINMDSQVARDCILPTIALLSHSDRGIREQALGLLEWYPSRVPCTGKTCAEQNDQLILDICSKIVEKSSPIRSSLVMDGVNTLPSLLSQISQSSAHQDFLIESCKACALNKSGDFLIGGCQAVAVLLLALEKAGEAAFPLSKRWELAGREMFKALMRFDHQTNDDTEELFVLPSSIGWLRDAVVSMLKGVLVNEAQGENENIQISIGPSATGRRFRSYSIGTSDSFTTLEPYPEDMLEALKKSISTASKSSSPLLLSKHVVKLVVARQSWANGVFPKLSSKSRKDVASALLTLRTRDYDELAGSALLGLPLKSNDFILLLDSVDSSQSEMDQASLVFIMDCMREKLGVMNATSDFSKLSSKLFDQLLSLSSVKKSTKSGDSGGRDYTRVAILQTLLAVHSHYKSELSVAIDKKNKKSSKRKRSQSHSDVGNSPKALASQANLLVGLLGGNTSEVHSLSSGRGKVLSLSLLTCLCEKSPSTVVTSLLPALMSLAGASSTTSHLADTKSLGDAIVAIVPAYCTHAASANLSLFDLLESFLGRMVVPGSDKHDKWRYALLDHLVDALKLLPTRDSSSNAIASLAACVMAILASKTTASDTDYGMSDRSDRKSELRLDLRILANTSSGIKIAVALSLVQYAKKLMSYICDGLSAFPAGEASSMRVSASEVAALAVLGNREQTITPSFIGAFSKLSGEQQRSILYLAVNLLRSVRDALSTPAARRTVQKSRGDDADVSLCLWNELMQTHTSIVRAQHIKKTEIGQDEISCTENNFWKVAQVTTGDCLDSLQNLLPVPHFLASASSILTDDNDDESYIHKKKIIRLLAHRVSEVNCDSPEASLFLEMVPDLVAQINLELATTPDYSKHSLALIRRFIVMKQGALIAIESFVRSLFPTTKNGKQMADAAAVFLPALDSITKFLEDTAATWNKTNGNSGKEDPSGVDAQCQLLSSISLCLSTLVTTLKARCLPQLPNIIKPLVHSLKSVNLLLEGSNEQATSSGELLQLSILKTLKAIVETMPQFILPYLQLIMSKNALPSKALRQGDNSVKIIAIEVETVLATKVQVRQLIPALSQSLSTNLQSDTAVQWEEVCSIINVMNIVVESSQRSDLSPVIGKIFNGLVIAYGYEEDDNSRPHMLQGANKCLLSLVMKMSEAQLRPLYAQLREWRGGIEDGTKQLVTSTRRHAFWSLSAELSKSLRSIFLPCLTSVLSDVLDELELAVNLLCKHTKKADGSKRRRVEETDIFVEDVEMVKPLQPLLLCLEYAFKADAHEGGIWTRGDDNQRYNMILNHLGKLLLAQVPKNAPLLSDLLPKEQASTSTYEQLVEGVGTLEHGNVVGCLSALAAAAGNEQLWKPLNFSVLEACSHKRSQVRKAGINCLLSIIETIGEEYMVLLPECLPVISELLEDDEQIAAMARECVRQGEELLGESLEASLR